MEVLPSDYKQIELSRDEKIFVRNVISYDQYGCLLLDANPAMLEKESMHILICSSGVLFLKFFDKFEDASMFGVIVPELVNALYNQTVGIISAKLLANKALVDSSGKLRFPINVVYVFPALERIDAEKYIDDELNEFVQYHCIFKEDLKIVRSDLAGLEAELLGHSVTDISPYTFKIGANSINSIMQRIAPEYVTLRVSKVVNEATKAGADDELLVVTKNDEAVKAFRLDDEQINIVNKIRRGDQLILACAGAGKSVLLIAKCFKAAAMNPEKKFLITCYNRNLCTLYRWFIDRAGLRAKNVACMTFHMLCQSLLVSNGYSLPLNNSATTDYYDALVISAIQRMNSGQIRDRYYGVFIDEVQQFAPEWYKLCFNLLEDKMADDHIFVICGDKTQKLANLHRHGRAPWNVGEGYPNYRGGNKNIRIERNYRNCIEINEYINRYVSYAKRYLLSIDQNLQIDPDEFLRGRSFFHGEGVTIKHLADRSNLGEARIVADSIQSIHDKSGIPYDEIAVIMYNRSCKWQFYGWNDESYNLEVPLKHLLNQRAIPFCEMYSSDDNYSARYKYGGSVRLITCQSVLGLDFRAAIVCGLAPLGRYNRTRRPNWMQIRADKDSFNKLLMHTQDDIRFPYVACTRAKEILHIILPESREYSVFVRLLEDAGK
ncbi:AAA family ATPase [bacterium]|nr:AAA family ATPase [bacterium]